MTEPEFLDLEDVLLIHEEQLAKYGGAAGIRDQGLLESALATPKATFGCGFVHEDLFAMAAAYAFHIAENQPFVDGNKRTGVLAAVVFLELNGFIVEEPPSRFSVGHAAARVGSARWSSRRATVSEPTAPASGRI